MQERRKKSVYPLIFLNYRLYTFSTVVDFLINFKNKQTLKVNK